MYSQSQVASLVSVMEGGVEAELCTRGVVYKLGAAIFRMDGVAWDVLTHDFARKPQDGITTNLCCAHCGVGMGHLAALLWTSRTIHSLYGSPWHRGWLAACEVWNCVRGWRDCYLSYGSVCLVSSAGARLC